MSIISPKPTKCTRRPDPLPKQEKMMRTHWFLVLQVRRLIFRLLFWPTSAVPNQSKTHGMKPLHPYNDLTPSRLRWSPTPPNSGHECNSEEENCCTSPHLKPTSGHSRWHWARHHVQEILLSASYKTQPSPAPICAATRRKKPHKSQSYHNRQGTFRQRCHR